MRSACAPAATPSAVVRLARVDGNESSAQRQWTERVFAIRGAPRTFQKETERGRRKKDGGGHWSDGSSTEYCTMMSTTQTPVDAFAFRIYSLHNACLGIYILTPPHAQSPLRPRQVRIATRSHFTHGPDSGTPNAAHAQQLPADNSWTFWLSPFNELMMMMMIFDMHTQ